jgi:uncharacterized membrane protein YqgA involved in biofilm formation
MNHFMNKLQVFLKVLIDGFCSAVLAYILGMSVALFPHFLPGTNAIWYYLFGYISVAIIIYPLCHGSIITRLFGEKLTDFFNTSIYIIGLIMTHVYISNAFVHTLDQ